MADWLQRFKKLFDGGKQGSSGGESGQRLATFLTVIKEDDLNTIESARDWVQPADLELLIALYWRLDSWQQKRALVDILQDQYHPQMQQMMLDFLRAPVAPGDEPIQLAQAVALGFIDERYDQFMTYYNDRKALARDVKAVLRKSGLEAERPPEVEKQAPAQPPPAGESSKPPNQRLMAAATAGELSAVKRALADGANIDVVIGSGDYEGCSALMMALMRKRFAVADYLIDQGADVNHKRPARHTPDRSRGQTPIWWAANHGNISLARKLLAKGADLNAPDHHGGTPLTTAAGSGQLEMVRFLVENGANVAAQIYDGRTAFNLAVTNGHRRVAEYLLSAGDQDPNQGGISGYTPLMVATEGGMLELVKMLINQGADVNAVHPGPGIYAGLRGWTPLVFAVRGGYVRLTKLLIQAGADVNYVVEAGSNSRGEEIPERRIIDFAAGKRAESVRKALRQAGAEEH